MSDLAKRVEAVQSAASYVARMTGRGGYSNVVLTCTSSRGNGAWRAAISDADGFKAEGSSADEALDRLVAVMRHAAEEELRHHKQRVDDLNAKLAEAERS